MKSVNPQFSLYGSKNECTRTDTVLFPFIPLISRSEQAPGSEFHPRDDSDKVDCDFLEPSWCKTNVNPETLVPCGSYELLVSNIAHQMKEKFMIQN